MPGFFLSFKTKLLRKLKVEKDNEKALFTQISYSKIYRVEYKKDQMDRCIQGKRSEEWETVQQTVFQQTAV